MMKAKPRCFLGCLTAALNQLSVVGCQPTIPPNAYQDSGELDRAVRENRAYLIDSRTREEYANGHIPGAVNIPHTEMQASIARVPKDRDVVLYCKAGVRSQKALEVLKAHGYTRLFNFGGVSQYQNALDQ